MIIPLLNTSQVIAWLTCIVHWHCIIDNERQSKGLSDPKTTGTDTTTLNSYLFRGIIYTAKIAQIQKTQIKKKTDDNSFFFSEWTQTEKP